MKLRRITAFFIIIFLVLMAYFYTAGRLMHSTPLSPAQAAQNRARAARGGLFNHPSAPIIH